MATNALQMQNTVHKAKHVRKKEFVDMMETPVLSMPKGVQNRSAAKAMEHVAIKKPLVVCLQKQDVKTLRTVRNMTIASKDTTGVSESNS